MRKELRESAHRAKNSNISRTDGRVEGGPFARRGLAVPSPVVQLLVEKPIDQSIACLAEIRTRGEDPAIDTGLDLALEEGGVAKFWSPGAVVANEAYCPPGLLTRRIQPQIFQQQKGVCGGDLARKNVGAAAPLTVGSLEVEEQGTPTLGGNPRPLTGNDLVRLVHGEIEQ
jgi:hypothetical protein